MHLQMVIQDKELLACIFHNMLTKMINQKGYIDWLAILIPARNSQRVVTLVREEHLQATASLDTRYWTRG